MTVVGTDRDATLTGTFAGWNTVIAGWQKGNLDYAAWLCESHPTVRFRGKGKGGDKAWQHA
jgi:hypothetical protein